MGRPGGASRREPPTLQYAGYGSHFFWHFGGARCRERQPALRPRRAQARLDPRLQGALSLPIGRPVARDVVGVLNVDGLDSVPPMLQTAHDPTLKTLVFTPWASTEKIRESLALADTGEPLHDD